MHDPVAARILPFIVFTLSALLVSTLSETPGALYPLRVGLMLGLLLLFVPIYRILPWRVDPLAIGIGTLVTAYWVAFPVTDPASAAP